MNLPKEILRNFVNIKEIACIVGEEELKTFIERKYFDKNDDLACITIHTPDTKGIKDSLLYSTFSEFLKIGFWDVAGEVVKSDDLKSIFYGITNEEAKTIAQFIIDNVDKQFVINCSAGISRSAGVGMAILAIKNFDGNIYEFNTSYDNPIKNHWRYKPNLYVFDKIIEEYKKLKGY